MDFSVNSKHSYRTTESDYRRVARKAVRREDEGEENRHAAYGEISPLLQQNVDVPDLNEAEARNLAYLVGRKLEEDPRLSLMQHPRSGKDELTAVDAFEAGEAVADGSHVLISEEARAFLSALL